MSDFILEYDILESIVKDSNSMGKRAEEYRKSLESRVISALGNVTGPSSAYLTSASDSVGDKINALKKKSDAFYHYAEQISNLLKVAEQVDQEVANTIAAQREFRIEHHESQRLGNWKAVLPNLLAGVGSSSLLAAQIAGLSAGIDTGSSKANIKLLYKSAEGKAAVTGKTANPVLPALTSKKALSKTSDLKSSKDNVKVTLKTTVKQDTQKPKSSVQQTDKTKDTAKAAASTTGDKSSIGSTSEFKKKFGETINKMAKDLGVDPNMLAAVILVESSGSGFVDGKLKIRFENHYFLKRTSEYKDLFTYDWRSHKYRTSTKEEWKTVHTGKQSSEYTAFNFAKSLKEEAAYQSISMGMGQIMGGNYKAAGYKSAKAMYEDFSKGHEQQIKGMGTFFKNYNNGNTLKALQKGDLETFVKQYNGNGQVETYTKLMKKRMEEYKKAK